ncbi:MAG: hypothetical protein AAB732_00420 [Patescibacteria group bacterium]
MPFFKKTKEQNNEDSKQKPELELKPEEKKEPFLEILKELEIIEKEEKREEEEGVASIKTEETLKKTPSVQIPQIPSAITPSKKIIKSETQQTIEKILLEDLEDIFLNLPLEKQKELEEKKEETSLKIEKIIAQVKVKLNKIFNLIKQWLKLIPGINKFFLEQETKIKMDKILELSKKIKK